MKKVLFAISAFALLMGAASCQDELGLEKVDNTTIGSSVANPLNTITVKMGSATRLGLDGTTPVFEAGDEVFGWDATGNYTYQCTAVSGSDATFTRASEYAPSADEGTKVNLVYAKGYSASDIVSGELSLDISKQDITSFEALPIVMTASGEVDASGKCSMTFVNETSVIKVDNCTSPATKKMTSVVARNLYPKLSISIDGDGNFVKTTGAAGTVSNLSTSTFTPVSKAFSFWVATFPTPDGTTAAEVDFLMTSSTNYLYRYTAGSKIIPANKIITVSGKTFSSVNYFMELEQTGKLYNTVTDAIADANAYSGPCTIRVLRDFSNTTVKQFTNPDGITLDLNGRTITIDTKYRMTPVSGGKLIIDGNGVITNSNPYNYTFSITDNSTLVIKSGKITQGSKVNNDPDAPIKLSAGTILMEGGSIDASGNEVNAIKISGTGQFIMNGGTIKGGTLSGDYDNSTMVVSGGTFTLNGGTVGTTTSRTITVSSGSVTVNGGTVVAQRNAFNCSGTGSITITGGEVWDNYYGYSLIYIQPDAKTEISISGGHIYAPARSISTFGPASNIGDDLSVTISGGYFNQDISATYSTYSGFTIGTCSACTETFNGRTYSYEVK